MTPQDSDKIRMLWIDDMEFDTSAHKSRLIEMIRNLQQSWDVRLLTSYRNEKVQPDELREDIIYPPKFPVPYLKRVTRYAAQCTNYRKILKTFRPNIVLMHSSNIALLKYATTLGKPNDTKLIYDVRTLPVEGNRIRNWINGGMQASCLRHAAKHFDGITYITEPMKQYCINQYGLPAHRSAIWTSGVNGDLFRPASRQNGAGPFTILYHGHIESQRRIDNVIKALPLLKDIDLRVNLLGNADGLEGLRRIATSLGVDDRVSFNESVSYTEVPDWIRRCDVGILPFQDWKGWNVSSPLKLFEYLACGKPVIVTDILAHRSVLKDADCAFWAKESSPEHISEAIRKAYEKRFDFDRLSKEARDLVVREYTWQRQAKRLGCFCDSLLFDNNSSCSA